MMALATSPASARVGQYANVLLPIGTFAETAGTFINVEGRWQSFDGAAQPVGASRPGWKVLRVLGNLFKLDNFEYVSAREVLDELHALLGDVELDTTYSGDYRPDADRLAEVAQAGRGPGAYQADALVRRSPPLQATREGQAAA